MLQLVHMLAINEAACLLTLPYGLPRIAQLTPFGLTMYRILIAIPTLMVALSACDASDPSTPLSLSFQTSAVFFSPGSEVNSQLENNSDRAIEYNICFAFLHLEQQNNDGWTPVAIGLGPDENAACTAQLNSLPAGDTAETTAYLPSDLDQGTYRLTTEVEVSGERRRIVTNSFEVR